VTFPTPTGDIIVPRNVTQSATPGSYGKLSVDQGSTLTLAPGDYFLDRLILETTSKLVLDQRTGPIRLFVKTELTYRGTFSTLPAGGNTFIHYVGVNAGFLEGPFTGTVLAPNGRIVVRKPYTGTLAAHDIQVDPDVVLQCSVPPPIAFALLGPAGLQSPGAPAGVAPSETSAEAPPATGCAVGGGAELGGAWIALLLLALLVRARAGRGRRSAAAP
jgi:hypothetical protein